VSVYTDAEVAAYVKQHGCVCGGDGKYTDYNCGAAYELTCPHCRGTGKKKCACKQPTRECP
jgi:hypothetical protein